MSTPNALRVFWVGFFVCACGGESVEEGLNARLDSASVVYHFGCDTLSNCPKPNRMCGDGTLGALRIALEAGEPVAIEVESASVEEVLLDYFFADATREGVRYEQGGSDMGLYCLFSNCGWREFAFHSLAVDTRNFDGQEEPFVKADSYTQSLKCNDDYLKEPSAASQKSPFGSLASRR